MAWKAWFTMQLRLFKLLEWRVVVSVLSCSSRSDEESSKRDSSLVERVRETHLSGRANWALATWPYAQFCVIKQTTIFRRRKLHLIWGHLLCFCQLFSFSIFCVAWWNHLTGMTCVYVCVCVYIYMSEFSYQIDTRSLSCVYPSILPTK